MISELKDISRRYVESLQSLKRETDKYAELEETVEEQKRSVALIESNIESLGKEIRECESEISDAHNIDDLTRREAIVGYNTSEIASLKRSINSCYDELGCERSKLSEFTRMMEDTRKSIVEIEIQSRELAHKYDRSIEELRKWQSTISNGATESSPKEFLNQNNLPKTEDDFVKEIEQDHKDFFDCLMMHINVALVNAQDLVMLAFKDNKKILSKQAEKFPDLPAAIALRRRRKKPISRSNKERIFVPFEEVLDNPEPDPLEGIESMPVTISQSPFGPGKTPPNPPYPKPLGNSHF